MDTNPHLAICFVSGVINLPTPQVWAHNSQRLWRTSTIWNSHASTTCLAGSRFLLTMMHYGAGHCWCGSGTGWSGERASWNSVYAVVLIAISSRELQKKKKANCHSGISMADGRCRDRPPVVTIWDAPFPRITWRIFFRYLICLGALPSP